MIAENLIELIVDDLLTDESGEKAVRLELKSSCGKDQPETSLGGLCREAIILRIYHVLLKNDLPKGIVDGVPENLILLIAADDRPIHAVVEGTGRDEVLYEVGDGGITAIVAYAENGQMEEVPWLAIYEEGILKVRTCAANKTIIYETT